MEHMSFAMPVEMAADVRDAVERGDYASPSEVVREALRDWSVKRAQRLDDRAALKVDIDKGLADVAAGRLVPFDAERIVAKGKVLSKTRSRSA